MAPTKPDSKKKMKEAFDAVDKDKSGSIDKSEMSELLKGLLGTAPPQPLVDVCTHLLFKFIFVELGKD